MRIVIRLPKEKRPMIGIHNVVVSVGTIKWIWILSFDKESHVPLVIQ